MGPISKLLPNGLHFINHDLWRIRRTGLSPGRSFFVALLRILVLTVRGFNKDNCQLRASALTFYSLVSIVPVAAMAFGIAKGFGFAKVLEAQLRQKFAGQEEVLNAVLTFAHSLLESTKGGLIAGVGLIVLFWAVIKLLGQIEDSLNDIWEIKDTRSWGRRFSDYLSLMLIGPVLVILSSSMTVFITTRVPLILEKISLLGIFSPVIFLLLKLLPYGLLWGLFTFLYIFMPNTKVRFLPGLLAGVAAGTLFQIVQWGYIKFQIGAAQYNAIYGSFAAFPLFLVWLQLSWLIVLSGAELSFACQHVDRYEFEPDALQASHRLKVLLSLQVAHHLIKIFTRGEAPPTAHEISHQLEIPIPLLEEILVSLCESKIITKVDSRKKEGEGFQPARDIHLLTIQAVTEALELKGVNHVPFAQWPEFSALSAAIETFREATDKLPANKLLMDL